jgi:hypothetical protein
LKDTQGGRDDLLPLCVSRFLKFFKVLQVLWLTLILFEDVTECGSRYSMHLSCILLIMTLNKDIMQYPGYVAAV